MILFNLKPGHEWNFDAYDPKEPLECKAELNKNRP